MKKTAVALLSLLGLVWSTPHGAASAILPHIG